MVAARTENRTFSSCFPKAKSSPSSFTMAVSETQDKPYLFHLQWTFFSSDVGLDVSYWGWVRVGMAQEVGAASGGSTAWEGILRTEAV